MALPVDRNTFKAWCLRKAADGVAKVNVSDDQVEDRVDEAILYFQEHHRQGYQKVYYKHTVTPSVLSVTGDTFIEKETVTGGTSNATAIVWSHGASLEVFKINGTFTIGETLTGSQSASTAVLDTVTLGDIDLGHFTIPDDILTVSDVLPISTGNNNAEIKFTLEYSALVESLNSMSDGTIVSYYITRSHYDLIKEIFRGKITYDFTRYMNRITLQSSTPLTPNDIVVFRASKAIDTATHTQLFTNEWLMRYTTALIRRQWGQNLIKFRGFNLPGNVQLDGQSLYQEANQEIEQLRNELSRKHRGTYGIFIG